MANTVTFKIKIEGEKELKSVTVDAEQLGKAFDAVQANVKGLKSELVSLSSAIQVIDGVANAVGQLQSVLSGFTSAYAAQETAETRLAQAMRNTMGASDDEIRAIKDLTAAQQAVGIVGDEVQLAAAQELATYLEFSDSLKTIIPVLNDMIAQQLGLGASAESATQIATMLGKVMNGQTEALSRYGYKFDEAQKHVLQFGTESERAAVLAEVVEQSVAGMNEAMAQTPSGRIQQLANSIGDVKEKIGQVVQGVMPFISVMSEITLAASGILKLTQTFKSFASLGITRLATSFTAANRAAVTFAANGLKMTASNARALVTAFGSARRASVALKAAMGGLAALAAGALALALTKLISKHREQKEVCEESAQAYRDSYAAVESTRSELQGVLATIKDFNGTSDEQAALIDRLNSKWGDTFGTFSTLADWYDVLSKRMDTYCQKLALQAELEQINARMGENILRRRQLEDSASSLPDTVTRTAAGMGVSYTESIPNLEKLKMLNEAESLGRTIEADKQRLSGLMSELAGVDASLKAPLESAKAAASGTSDSAKTLADDIAVLRRSVQADVEVNRVFNGSLNEQDVVIRSMESGITSLIRKYGLENSAVQGLVAEYGALLRSRRSIDDALPDLPGITASASTESGGLRPAGDLTPDIKVDKVNAATEALSALSSAMGSLASAVGEGAAQWLRWLGSLLSAVGQALPQIAALVAARKAEATANAEAAVTGAAASVAGVPGVGAIMAAASVASVLAAIMSVPKFAGGGLVSGPTLALVGEYPGAAGNPEVIAPLDKLSGLLSSGFGPGEVRFRIEGRDLAGVLKKVNSLERRS